MLEELGDTVRLAPQMILKQCRERASNALQSECLEGFARGAQVMQVFSSRGL